MDNSHKRSWPSFLKFAGAALMSGFGLAYSGWQYVTKFEPGWLEITSHSLILPRLHPVFDNYRIIQISDIHMETWINRERLVKVIKTINLMRPDAVMITGDFVTDLHHRTPSDLTYALGKLRARDGIFAVLGNHDYWTSARTIRQILSSCQILELPNAVHTIQRDSANLHICGVDDYWENKSRLPSVLSQLPPDGAAILLAHEPDFAKISSASGRFDLQLSGHSHGGQVIIPWIGPLVLPMYGRLYPNGLYEVNDMLLYTNRGLGTARPQVRFNCRPEISVFTLHAPMV